MSPELEALLRADFERHNCDPQNRAKFQTTFERLFQDALAKSPGLAREEFAARDFSTAPTVAT